MFIHHIIYGAHTNFCYRLIAVHSGKQWDNTNLALSASPTYANTAISVSRDTAIAGFPITLPGTLPAGNYDFLVYNAASPANTDNPVLGYRIGWNGKEITSIASI